MKILVVGEEHIRAKVARHYQMLEERYDIETHYFVDDRSGITREVAKEIPLRVHYTAPPKYSVGSALAYLRSFARCFEQVRPDVLEVYTSMHAAVTLAMMAYAAARGVPRVIISRGELYPAEIARSGRIDTALRSSLFRAASLVVYKELYIPEVLDRIAPRAPRLEWRNAIPVGAEPAYERTENVVLFLNLFKEWRNLELIVDAAPVVRAAVPDVQFHLVGGAARLAGTSPFYAAMEKVEQGIRQRIESVGASAYVHIHPFTNEVAPWYARARTYLLPADLVFCNYSLIEAMERGVPPIVCDEVDPDARLIVEDGVSGLLVGKESAALAAAIIAMLSDEPRRQQLARGARAKIIAEYNLGARLEALVDAYRSLAPRAAPELKPVCVE